MRTCALVVSASASAPIGAFLADDQRWPPETDAATRARKDRIMTVISGVDIVFARPVPARALEREVSALLGVPSSRVVVVAGVADYPTMESAEVVCVTTAVDGDFTQLVAIHLQPRELRDHTSVSFAQRLAEALSVPCIVPDEGLDPCAVILIEPGERPNLCTSTTRQSTKTGMSWPNDPDVSELHRSRSDGWQSRAPARTDRLSAAPWRAPGASTSARRRERPDRARTLRRVECLENGDRESRPANAPPVALLNITTPVRELRTKICGGLVAVDPAAVAEPQQLPAPERLAADAVAAREVPVGHDQAGEVFVQPIARQDRRRASAELERNEGGEIPPRSLTAGSHLTRIERSSQAANADDDRRDQKRQGEPPAPLLVEQGAQFWNRASWSASGFDLP